MHFDENSGDFKTAADELRRPVTLEEIARECGVSVDDVRHAMLVEGSDAHVPPPRSWKEDLAYLARERAAELVELADELESSAWAPATREELEEIGSIILNRFERMKESRGAWADPRDLKSGADEPPTAMEERKEDFQQRWAEIQKRRDERKKRREEEVAKLDDLFLRGLGKAPGG